MWGRGLGGQEGVGGRVAHSFVHWIYLIGACKNSLTEDNCACCWIMDHSRDGLPGTGAGTTVPCWTHGFLSPCFCLQVKNLPQIPHPPPHPPNNFLPSSSPLPLHPLAIFPPLKALWAGVHKFNGENRTKLFIVENEGTGFSSALNFKYILNTF